MSPLLRKAIPGPPPRSARRLLRGLPLVVALLSGCSLNGYITGKVADALAGTGGGYASDEDLDLIRDAAPFGLKTMEQVLEQKPRHVGLLTSLASGYTSYSVAFVQEEADELADRDLVHARGLELRARKLYLRARDFALRGLDVGHPGFAALFRSATPASLPDRERMLARMTKKDVPLLYWAAASWGLAISAGKNEMKLVGDLAVVEALMGRALALDESYDEGSIHEFYVAYDASRSSDEGGGPERAKAHLDRALLLSRNSKIGGLVSYVEGISVAQQDKATYKKLLEQVLAFDVDSAPSHRLANLLAQRRARWLLGRTSELFAE